MTEQKRNAWTKQNGGTKTKWPNQNKMAEPKQND